MFGNTIKVKSKDELSDLIKFIVKYRDINADLNFIDVSEITDMSSLFDNSKFKTLQIASLIPGGVKLSYSKFLASFDLVGALGTVIELLM